MIYIIPAVLLATGLFIILKNVFQLPDKKVSRAMLSLAGKSRKKKSRINDILTNMAIWISGKLRLSEYKKETLKSDLTSAGMDITPEMHVANSVTKAITVGVFAIPCLFIFPVLSPIVLVLAFYEYKRESERVSREIRKKRERIEEDLPAFVSLAARTFSHSRDIVGLMESAAASCGSELSKELKITAADMKTGNHEAAIVRLETRTGSAMVSDVTRGLQGVLRGDDTLPYWKNLEIKFADLRRQQLKRKANALPRKVKRLSMSLMFCFILIYAVVMVTEITNSLGVLFG